MEISSEFVYAIRDKISGKFLNNLWLSDNNVKSIFTSEEEAEYRISRLKLSKFTSKGYLNYNVEDLEIVKFKLIVCN